MPTSFFIFDIDGTLIDSNEFHAKAWQLAFYVFGKPQPDIILAAIRKLRNPRKDRILMVGDSPFDALAARKAGIKMVGVLCGGFSKAHPHSKWKFSRFQKSGTAS